MSRLLIIAGLAAGLAACASGPTPRTAVMLSDHDRQAQECRAAGGMLQPSGRYGSPRQQFQCNRIGMPPPAVVPRQAS